jgi:hypothetical protein
MVTSSDSTLEKPATVVQVCRLHFTDGQTVSAQIETGSLREESAITYSGPCERLPFCYPTADVVLLRALFQSFARELAARFEEKLIGSWNAPELELEADEPSTAV